MFPHGRFRARALIAIIRGQWFIRLRWMFLIAASALLYFLILAAYQTVYGPLFSTLGDQPALFLGVKFALSVAILFPPAFFMGGTLPLMGQYLVQRREQLGLKASLLYTVNTLGAATGALLAGFYLPPTLGFKKSYFFAILLNVARSLAAKRLDIPCGH